MKANRLEIVRLFEVIGLVLLSALFVATNGSAQQFDFDKLRSKMTDYTLVMDIAVEFSFGMQTSEQEMRLLATIVSEDGLVIFDGSPLEPEHPFSAFSSMAIKATPTRIELKTLDGETTYEAEYVGTDRYTRIGFARIIADEGTRFPFVRFAEKKIAIGDWVSLFMLLPEYVTPPLGADVGMVSALIEQPEAFPLIVGFAPSEMLSVLFDKNLDPVGVLGLLPDPSSNGDGGFLSSMGQSEFPMLGIVSGKQIEKLIADPPTKGKVDRGWLGITLQALSPDIQDFFGLSVPGGIIVNEIVANAPAQQAGLEVGDIIIEVNGQPVEVDMEEKIPVFQRQIAEMGPNTPVDFTVIRPGETATDTMQLVATLGEAPLAAVDAAEFESDDLEMKVRDLVFSDYMLFNMEPDSFSGVVVSELEQGGLADIGGLGIGDVIQRVGSTDITSVVEAEGALTAIAEEKPSEIVFFVWRDNKTMFVNVKTDWQE